MTICRGGAKTYHITCVIICDGLGIADGRWDLIIRKRKSLTIDIQQFFSSNKFSSHTHDSQKKKKKTIFKK